MMKNWYSRHIALILLATASLTAVAQEEPHDTVYFYTTWTQIFDMAPETMVVDPAIDVYSPFHSMWKLAIRRPTRESRMSILPPHWVTAHGWSTAIT